MEEDQENSYEYSRLPTNDPSINVDNEEDSLYDDVSVVAARSVVDRFSVVKLAFCIFGVVTLLPWFFFLTPTNYWMYKFRNVSEDHIVGPTQNKTQLQKFFFSYLSISCNVPTFLGLLWCLFFGHRVSEYLRNVISLLGMTLLFILLTACVYVNSDHRQILFLCFVLLTSAVISACSGVYQASITGVASLFPSNYVHALITGQAWAGIFSICAQILILLDDMTPLKSALCFFTSCDFVMLVCLVLFFIGRRMSFFKHYSGDLKSPLLETTQFTRLRVCVAHVWIDALSVFYTFFVSLSLVPIGVLVVPENPNRSIWSGRLFIPVCFLFLYNVGDFCGRKFGGYVPLRRPHLLLFLCLLRTALIPLVLLCNVQPRTHLPVVFHSELYFIVFNVCLAFTNGYSMVIPMVEAPKRVPPQLREMTGFFMSTALVGGVALGSLFSLLLVHIT